MTWHATHSATATWTQRHKAAKIMKTYRDQHNVTQAIEYFGLSHPAYVNTCENMKRHKDGESHRCPAWVILKVLEKA